MIHLVWEWYGQIWPNLAASLIWSVPFYLWHHQKTVRKFVEHLEKLEARRAEEAGGEAQAGGPQEGLREEADGGLRVRHVGQDQETE